MNKEKKLENKQNVELLKEGSLTKNRKLTGFGFMLMLGFALIKDLLDLLNLTMILSAMSVFFTIFFNITLFFYLFMNGISFTGRYAGRKLAVLAGQFIIEVIPFVNIIPATALSLVVLRTIENHIFLKKIVTKVEELNVI